MTIDEADNFITRIRRGVLQHLQKLAEQDLAEWDEMERLEIQWNCEVILDRLANHSPTA